MLHNSSVKKSQLQYNARHFFNKLPKAVKQEQNLKTYTNKLTTVLTKRTYNKINQYF